MSKKAITRQNEPLSAITHLAASLLSIAGLVLMVNFAAKEGQAILVVGVSIFGSSLILLYLSSAFYHFAYQGSRIKKITRKLDHAMIFFLIAGTYTPVVFAMPQRGWGWSIFGVIWGIALLGMIIKLTGIKLNNVFSLLFYISMGWLIIIAIKPIINWLPKEALNFLVGGGMLYTFGCIFFALDKIVPRKRWVGMHEVFHFFVIAGSFCHFWLVLKYIS